MRKQHHYSSEQQILKKVDAAREKANELNVKAETCEAQSAECFKQAQKLIDEWEGKLVGKFSKEAQEKLIEANNLKNQFFNLKDEAIKCRKKARRIEEFKLPKFGESLSEFRTEPMAILGDNTSVVGPA